MPLSEGEDDAKRQLSCRRDRIGERKRRAVSPLDHVYSKRTGDFFETLKQTFPHLREKHVDSRDCVTGGGSDGECVGACSRAQCVVDSAGLVLNLPPHASR